MLRIVCSRQSLLYYSIKEHHSAAVHNDNKLQVTPGLLRWRNTRHSGSKPLDFVHNSFYRAMHFSAKRGIAIACRLSVSLSVTLMNCDHIGWNSSKIISPLVSLGCSLFATPTWRVCSKGNTPKFGPKVTHPLIIWALETFDRKLWPNGYR